MSGPLGLKDVSGDYTATASDSDIVLRFTGAGLVRIPSDEMAGWRLGTQLAIESFVGDVIVAPDSGVIVGSSEGLRVGPLRTGVLVKQNANFWLMSLGSGGSSTGAVPTPPLNPAATPGAGQATVTWAKPADDGGHSITSYLVEKSSDNKTWVSGGVVDGSILTITLTGLTAGTWYFRVRALTTVGSSDPSTVVSCAVTAPFNDATGGDEVNDVPNYNGTGQTWRYHKFTASGELVVKTAAQPFHVLVVAGGGGGGGGGPYAGGGGGGGAGGYLDKPTQTLLAQKYPVVVGSGGAGGEGIRSGTHNGVAGRPGGNSSIAGIEATGGGGGEAYQDGGSGGGSGGGSYDKRNSNYPGIAGQGNNGGPGEGGSTAGAGGGGGGATSAGVPNGGGAGKTSNITGADASYANGGGCAETTGPAAPNTGNGGNGIKYGSPNYGGTGGSGVVIVAYRIK